MKRQTVFLLMLGAVVLLPGCREGGTFFNDMERYVAKESDQAGEMLPTLGRYNKEEVDRTKQFGKKSLAFWGDNLAEKDVLRASWDRYREVERRKRPSLREMSPKGSDGEIIIKRTFPNDDGVRR